MFGLEGKGLGVFKHFGDHDKFLATYTGHADIPIRRPESILMSWQADKFLGDEHEALRRIDLLIEWTTNRPDTQFWVIEKQPLVVGEGDETGRDEGRARALVASWRSPKRDQFYERFYP